MATVSLAPVVRNVHRIDSNKAVRQPRRNGRRGRPRKLDAGSSDTRTRLLQAAFDAFVDHGFESTTIEGIAQRAGLTKTAIYNHFGGKDDLIMHSARFALATALSQLKASEGTRANRRPPYVRAYMSPEFARTRRLLAEIHITAMRHPRLGKMLSQWHWEVFAAETGGKGVRAATRVKACYMILLGICLLDSFRVIDAPPDRLTAAMEAAAAAVVAAS
jgi:AcrR family transcriptional regulator